MLKFVSVVLMECPLDAPFAPKMKCVDPYVGAAALSAGANILGGLFGYGSQSDANATNLEIAKMNQQSVRETNKLNEQMFNHQLAYNEKMWNLQNEYNSPYEQVQRLKKAGINPAAVFGNGSVSQAGGISAPNAPQMTPPTLDYQKQPYDISGAFQGAVNAYQQSRLASAEVKKSEELTHGIHLDNEEKEKGMIDRLDYLKKLAKEKGYVGELAKTQLDFEVKAFNLRHALLGADYTMRLKEINNMQEQFNSARLQNELYKIQIAYAPRLNDAQLKQYYETVNQLKAQIGLINSNRLLTDEQRLHEVQKKTSTILDNGLKGFDVKLRNEVQSYLRRDIIESSHQNYLRSGMLETDAKMHKFGKFMNYVHSFVPNMGILAK